MPKIFNKNQNFYVLHLKSRDKRRLEGKIFQIQVIDENGLAISFGYISEEDNKLIIDDCLVPAKVIEAAKRQNIGCGDFVDMNGEQVLPKNF